MKKILSVLIIFSSFNFANEANITKKWSLKFDPVYQLPIDKYKKFSTEMVLKDGRKIEFVSVKSMMNFYFNPKKYPELGVKNRTQIDKMYVKSYLTGKKIDAKNAWYVFGSRLVGPHGDDLIPLANPTEVELFKKKYGGTKVMRIDRFTSGLIRYLDM